MGKRAARRRSGQVAGNIFIFDIYFEWEKMSEGGIMTDEEILREIGSLPPEAQREVEDFVAFLHQRYGRLAVVAQPVTSELRAEKFVGMWQDRDEMLDSGAWVRTVRESEWVK